MNIFKTNLTDVYTQSNSVSQVLGQLIVIYAFSCILDFSNAYLSCLMRLTNNVAIFSKLAFFYCVILRGVLSYVFCFTLDMKASGL